MGRAVPHPWNRVLLWRGGRSSVWRQLDPDSNSPKILILPVVPPVSQGRHTLKGVMEGNWEKQKEQGKLDRGKKKKKQTRKGVNGVLESTLIHERRWCVSLPSSVSSDFTSVPHLKLATVGYLHHRNEKMLQIRAFFLPPQRLVCWLLKQR